MDTTASFVRGATPTITVTVDHDLSGLHVVVPQLRPPRAGAPSDTEEAA